MAGESQSHSGGAALGHQPTTPWDDPYIRRLLLSTSLRRHAEK